MACIFILLITLFYSKSLNFKNFIEVYLIYDFTLVSGVQHSKLTIHYEKLTIYVVKLQSPYTQYY